MLVKTNKSSLYRTKPNASLMRFKTNGVSTYPRKDFRKLVKNVSDDYDLFCKARDAGATVITLEVGDQVYDIDHIIENVAAWYQWYEEILYGVRPLVDLAGKPVTLTDK